MTRCYAKYSSPAYKGRLSHGSIAYLPTLLIISETYRKPSWDNTYVPLGINKTSTRCKT